MAKTKRTTDNAGAMSFGAPESKDTANHESKREALISELTKMLTDTDAEGKARAIVYAIERMQIEQA